MRDLLPAIPAQSYYLGGHLICASLSRPLIARTAMEVARHERIDVLVHTSNPPQK